MYCIDVLLEEHDHITDFIKVARNACCSIIDDQPIYNDDFNKMLNFGKVYADSLHHKKEEDILFNAMIQEVGGPAEKMIRNGMLVEHDIGRLYLSELDKAMNEYLLSPSTQLKLKIITNLSAYCDLLERHIVKENQVAYPFGQKTLSTQTLQRLDDETKHFENNSQNASHREYYLNVLNELQEKYC